MSRPESSLPAAYFAALYQADADPWRFASSDYERRKYAATLAALPRQAYRRGFEVGCSIGVLTSQLARRCDHLLAVDVADQALAQARARCAGQPGVRLERMEVPSQLPDSSFDLLLLSEVVYYWSVGDLERMAAVPEIIEPGVGRPPRLLAALGPKMIQLSGELTDGAHPYLVTPEHTKVTRELLGPDKWVVSEVPVAIGGDDSDQLRRVHAHLEVYSGLPNYRNSWLRQGFDDSDLVRGGSDRLARALVGMGSLADAAASVTAHLDAGADHVVIQVLGERPGIDPRPALRELAAELGLGATGFR